MRLLAPIVLGLALALAGCGEKSDEDEIRTVVGDYVKAVKNSDGGDLCKLLTGRPLAEAQASGACDLEAQGARGLVDVVEVADVRITGSHANAELRQGRSVAAIGLVEREGFWFIERIELLRSELRIPDAALEPELAEGDVVLVDATAYRDGRDPQPGDLVVFEDPGPLVRRVERVADGRVVLEGHGPIAVGDVIGRVQRRLD